MPEPTIDEAALRKALQHWDLGVIREIAPLAGGHNAQLWRLDSSTGRSVAKFAWDTAPFEGGLQIAEQLEAMGFSAGRPLRAREGALAMHLNGGALGVMEFVSGISPGLAADGLRAWGAAMGRMHRHLQRIPHIPATLARWPWRWLDAAAPYVASRAWLRAAVTGAIAAAQRAIDAGAMLGVIHGDGAQILADPATGRVAVIDWGAAMFGPLLYDVGTAYWLAVFEHGLEPPSFAAFTDSYREAGPPGESQLSMLPTFVQLRAAIHAFYFAWRCDNQILTGLTDPSENEMKLEQARQFLEGQSPARTRRVP